MNTHSALVLVLTACLVGSAFPVTAEEKTGSTAGPVAQAVAREAARLVADAPTASPDSGRIQQADTSESDWSRVRQLAPGTEIIVAVRNAPSEKRTVASADASALIVATPNDPRATTSIARTDIVSITVVKTRGWVGGLLGAAGGAALGLAIGWSRVHNSGREVYDALVWGPVIGGVAGGFLGSRTLRQTTVDVIYRAS